MKSWWLVADIGGTNARFWALAPGTDQPFWACQYLVEDCPDFLTVITHTLAELADSTKAVGPPERACFAVACPTDIERMVFTNSHWNFSAAELESALPGCSVEIINDFAAVAHAIPALNPADTLQLGGGSELQNKAKVVLGAGTGLGVAALIPDSGRYLILESEGGHADYAPIGDLQIEVKRILRSQFNRVCIERVLSGPGLVNVCRALGSIQQRTVKYTTPAEIVAADIADQDELALETLDFFCNVAGAVAGNLALTFAAKGGVYIAGGVLPRFSAVLSNSGFRSAFEDKGRFRGYLSDIPCYLVTKTDIGLFGASRYLTVDNKPHV